ncbi:MAG: WD40 repeat domain-containing protein [Bacteroidetes bacterium]|nr:MAG: WD40 repeat domain-containing protein [Bacteroidota bacterium]
MSGIQVNKVHTFIGHKDAVYTLEPVTGQSAFFSGAADGMVVRWDLDEPDKGQLVVNLPNSVYALQYIKEKHQLVVGHNFQGIHVIDLLKNEEVGSLSLPKSAIFDLKQVDSRLLVSTADGSVFVIDLEELRILEQLNHSGKSARCISINIESEEFAVGYSDHMVRIFDINTYRLKYELAGHTNSVFTVAYHPKQPMLLSGGRDAHLKMWSIEDNYSLQESVVAHMYAINHLEFSPNGQLFVTCSMDKSIKVWNAQEFKLLKVIDKDRYAGHGTSVNKLYWSPYNQQLASCSDDRTISIWDLKT